MKHRWMIKSISLLLTVGFLFTANQSDAQGRRGLIVIGPISPTEADSLIFMREEEKLARDVYLAMYEKWGLFIFSNIASSEQNHMDAIKLRLDAYGLDDPIQDVGIFTNQELQELYNSLIEQGNLSELDALKVGALIEEVDIQDLQDILEQTTLTDLQRVYENLLAGSENHLRAFVRWIEMAGEEYIPQVLTPAEVDEILAASNPKQGGKGQNGKQQYGNRGYGTKETESTGMRARIRNI